MIMSVSMTDNVIAEKNVSLLLPPVFKYFMLTKHTARRTYSGLSSTRVENDDLEEEYAPLGY